TLAAGSGTVTLGAATLADAVTLTIGTGDSGGISLTSIAGTAGSTPSNVTINVTGAVTVSGTVGTDIGTLTVTDSGGTTFSGAVGGSTDRIASLVLAATTGTIAYSSDLYATAITNAGGNFALNLHGSTTDVNNAVTFGTSGALALGNGSDTLTFTGGLVHTAGASTLAGNITTSNTDIQLAGLTLASNSDVDTTGSSAGNIVFTSTIATAGFALALDAGPAGNISLAGNLTGGGAMTVRDGNVQAYAALTVASLNIQDATTSVTFNGNVTTTGAITVASGGSVFQNGTLSAGSTTTITSTGSGDLSITSITATNQPVTLSAPSGSITQSSGSITASTLEITASAGIGTAGSPITTATSGMTLAARSTTGGIFVVNTGA
ncbi:MAG: beta strand repeat-containing protein, partial [Planctomyces sp.]